MLQIEKKSTLYEVKETAKSDAQVAGTFAVTAAGKVQNMHLTYSKGQQACGDVYYSEEEGNICCNYNYSDVAIKADVESLTNNVLTEIKQQIAASK